MKILLINVDCRWNLAIRKLYNYYAGRGDKVVMRDLGYSYYPHNKHCVIDQSGYDKVYVSLIFENNRYRVKILNCDNVDIGGIGSLTPEKKLPPEIENTQPFYYDWEDTQYGFITRGCIRKCWFCKVPIQEGDLAEAGNVETIVGNFKKQCFLDNNILAYPFHKQVFRWLIKNSIKCDFNQGLDFRLVDEEDLLLLSQMKYEDRYIFQLDDPALLSVADKKIELMKKYLGKWRITFYCYFHPSMSVSDLINRCNWCKNHECLPYIMRDRSCWSLPIDFRRFLIQYTRWCNQPSMFKSMDFPAFVNIEYKNNPKGQSVLSFYNGTNVTQGTLDGLI